MCTLTTIELFVCKIVLHYVNQSSINSTAFLLLKLIPRNNIPITNKSNNFLVTTHLYEKSCACNITTTYEYSVR